MKDEEDTDFFFFFSINSKFNDLEIRNKSPYIDQGERIPFYMTRLKEWESNL